MDGYAPPKKMSGCTGLQLIEAYKCTHDTNLAPGERKLIQHIKHSEEPAAYNNFGGNNPFRKDPGAYLYDQDAQNVLDNLKSKYGPPSFPQ